MTLVQYRLLLPHPAILHRTPDRQFDLPKVSPHLVQQSTNFPVRARRPRFSLKRPPVIRASDYYFCVVPTLTVEETLPHTQKKGGGSITLSQGRGSTLEYCPGLYLNVYPLC